MIGVGVSSDAPEGAVERKFWMANVAIEGSRNGIAAKRATIHDFVDDGSTALTSVRTIRMLFSFASVIRGIHGQ